MADRAVSHIDRAINRLRSLQEGDLGVVEVIACGDGTIPALRDILFKREPSGLYQTRCRTVEALGALGAFDVLLEFLRANRIISDPVERVGEDAVINAAAQALSRRRDQDVLDVLLRLAKKPSLTGVIGALGTFRDVKTIQPLVNALEDDASRPTAEAALKRLGSVARPALIAAARSRIPSFEQESETSHRRRRSALGLLSEIGVPKRAWPALRPMLHDHDAKVAFLTCKICLTKGSNLDKEAAIRRLIDLLAEAEWGLADQISACLVDHYDEAEHAIAEFLATHDSAAERPSKAVRSLRQVQTRATSN
jgi:hypothetical protein